MKMRQHSILMYYVQLHIVHNDSLIHKIHNGNNYRISTI